jgi:phage internal scaffolding protein
MPLTGDFVDVPDFQTALNLVISAQDEFMKVPADVRARFNNDPGELMAFLEDDKNRDEAIKLGLVNAPPEKTRDVVQAVDELAAKLVPKA